MQKKRILFVAEAATFAHVLRPLVLAKALDPARYDIHIACAKNDLMVGKEFIFEGTGFTHWEITSQPSSAFLAAVNNGQQLFNYATLAAYAKEDIALMERVKPDLVVGDMRWSLPTSAAVCKVPCAIIQNAPWSPYADPMIFPLPEFDQINRAVRRFGHRLVNFVFKCVKPFALYYRNIPLNRLRRDYGLPTYNNHFASINGGDYVLYADIAELVPTAHLPAHHRYLGSITWAPDIAPPEWWSRIPGDKPIVYVALGSSGNAALIPTILAVLKERPVTVLLAGPAHFSDAQVFAAPFFPWDDAAKRSVLMIGNGGSGAIYQSIAAGIPQLGIVSNQDQLMAMAHAEIEGCGIMLRASEANHQTIAQAVDRLLSEDAPRQSAQRLRTALSRYNAGKNFARFVAEVVG